MNDNPKQVEGLDINECVDGYVIYHSEKDRIHFLNHTAVLVLELCNGERSMDEIAEVVEKMYGMKKSQKESIVEAIKKLYEEGLLKSI
ncbi:PqqD family protein [Thermodesulfobacteriota bacterium]